MIYEIDEGVLKPVYQSKWTPKELELEKYLTYSESEVEIISHPYFGEPLIKLGTQVRLAGKKRADIIALDKKGNSVIIELKQGTGKLGVDTQALQYLADMSRYRGRNFLKKFPNITEDTVSGFCGSDAVIEELNTQTRIILLAQDFDPALYSMGEWLSSKGVAFRCIRYTPFEKSGTRMLSFSVAFDRSPGSLFDLSFSSKFREPAIFWHNIARANHEWWDFLRKEGQIPACFDNMPGDQGEKVLSKYIEGDRIIAFAKGYGAVGWGIVENPNYRLLKLGDKSDKLSGDCRHRIDIKWKAAASVLQDGLSVDVIREKFNIYHPISTSVSIPRQNGEQLIQALSSHLAVND